ncbi:MAG: lipid A export permease/ATP-binding protein MsbA [Burkholderiales bacterium]|nr:lipid A export permease/ATP-binding protein MsbA [Burkholderiales bacterium]MCE7878641.1 lipid A export permease/ATP-binding protein MsbA [Betaproteobacteria bacterium PRO3]
MTGTSLYRRLLGFVRPYWWTFALAIVGMVAVAAGDLLMAWLVIPVVQNFQSPDPERTRWLPLVIVGVFALRGAGSYVSEYGMAYTGNRVVFDLRRRLIDKLLALPTPFYDQTAAGVVQSKVTFDAHQLANAASGTITTAVRSTLTIVASFGWLMWLNWRLTLLTFVILPVVGVTIRYFSRRLRRIARDIQARTGSMTHVLEELIGGHRIVRIFGGETWERDRAVKAANALRVSMTRQSAASAASSPITQGLAAVAVGLIVWAALAQSQDGRLDLPTFTSYVVALITLLERLKALSGINAAIQRGLAAAESIFGLLDREDEPDHGTVALDRVRGEIRCERVSLRYLGTERDALADVSLTIAPGETVALVGASGSGKTSLVNLVPRFYEPSSGRLFVDGHDVTTLTLASLRRHIAMVAQDVLLFDDTIRANIAYGAMAGADDAAVEHAAAAAHALEFIRALPQGFETPVGEQGVRLSGGQRQRIAIARAILKDAPILILDEATSALDSASERQVQAALDTLMRGRTTIVIAHRLSTIEHAHRIVVLDRGRVVEEGTHAELIARDGPYARLHRIQFATAGG